MKTFDELAVELKLSPQQKSAVEKYFNELVIELLESIKKDNIDNFDETINTLKSQ